MSINIEYGGSSAKVVGMPASKDFSITAAPDVYTYEESFLHYIRPDFEITYTSHEVTTTHELKVTFSGDLTGLRDIKFIPTENDVNGATENLMLLNDGHIYCPNGLASFQIQADNVYGRRTSEVYTINTVAVEVPPFHSSTLSMQSKKYTAGSLGEHLWDTMGKYAPSVFSPEKINQFLDGGEWTNAAGDGSDATVNVTPNPEFAFSMFDWSGISLLQGEVGSVDLWGLPCSLISPRHAIFANHVIVNPVGKWVVFRKKDGSYIRAQIVSSRNFPDYPLQSGGVVKTDVAIVYFDRVIENCEFFKLLPSDFEDYVPSFNVIDGNLAINKESLSMLPVLMRLANNGLEEEANINPWNGPGFWLRGLSYTRVVGTSYNAQLVKIPSSWGSLANLQRALYPGDSSSPAFFLIEEQVNHQPIPVLLGALYTGGSFGALYKIADWIVDTVQELAIEVGDSPVYQPTFVNLSRFTKYDKNARNTATVITNRFGGNNITTYK
jgi:hypothetical protein